MVDDAMLRLAKSFEAGAAAYERYRLQFPGALFDDLFAAAGTRVQQGVLEVGAGTGRATVPLARRGAQIQAIEPSGDMLRVLEQRLNAENLQDTVTLRQATFEDIDPAKGSYGVVVAAQSFHWTDPRTRWARLAALLDHDGIAFLFWNNWYLDPIHHQLNDVRDAYRRHGPNLTPDIEHDRAGNGRSADEIAAEPALRAALERTYSWNQALPVESYLSLLATTSQYAVADPEERRRLFTALRTILGATVHLSVSTLCISTSPSVHKD